MVLRTMVVEGNANVWNVERNDDGKLWLNTDYANPDNEWNLDNELLLRLRKSFHFFSPTTGEFCFTS